MIFNISKFFKKFIICKEFKCYMYRMYGVDILYNIFLIFVMLFFVLKKINLEKTF